MDREQAKNECKSRFLELLIAEGHAPNRSNKLKCFIPGHNDKNPSMTYYPDSYTCTCFACNKKGIDVFAYPKIVYGMNDKDSFDYVYNFFNAPIDKQIQEKGPIEKYIFSRFYTEIGKENVSNIGDFKRYSYKSAAGKELFCKYRIDYTTKQGEKAKFIRQGIENDSHTKTNLKLDRNKSYIAMYGDFRQFQPGEKVYYAEGEKCVDVMRNKGFLSCTCGSSGDFSKNGKQFAPYFKGVDVVILQDNDNAGKKLTSDIISFLYGVARSIKIIIPMQNEKEDIYDYFSSGKTIEDFNKLEVSTPFYHPEKQKQIQKKNLDQFHHVGKSGPTSPFDYAILEDIKQHHPLFVCGGIAYIYESGAYTEDFSGVKLKEIIKGYLYEQFIKSRIINQIYNLIIDDCELQKNFDELNDFPDSYICFLDCVYDSKTGKTFSHSPLFYCINQIPFKYSDIKRMGEGQNVDNFLNFAIDNAEDRKMLLQYAGLCLTTSTEQQKFLVLYGTGGTGKSLIIRMIEKCVGSKNICNVPLEKLNERFTTSQLTGKLLNSCADLSADALEDSSTIKKILGEDLLFAERKGQNGYSFRNFSKQLFSTNTLPVIKNERNNGFFRRLLIIPMNNKPKNIDPFLFQKLEKELPYFIRLCLNELFLMFKNGGLLFTSQNSIEQVQQMEMDSDVISAWMQECCEIGAEYKTERRILFASFEQFCEQEERTPLSKNGFFKALRNKNYSELKINGFYQFKGVTLKNQCPFD